jgi:hypothetical protein
MNALGWLLVGTLLVSGAASAQVGWHDSSGNLLPETESMKSRGGLGATLLITPDKDWQAKWNTSPETVPRFNQAKEVGPGGALYILTLLSNLAADPTTGMTNITCDFAVVRPDGTDSVRQRDLPCLKMYLMGNPGNVYLSAAAMMYRADPGDPRGVWRVAVTVKDHVRNVSIPLQSSFVVH